jgi:DNA-binding NarL/FixJ family response regulator
MSSEMSSTPSQKSEAPLRALCIARHSFLSEHIARYFADMGVATTNAVGLDSAARAAKDTSPDLVICDYDVLAAIPLQQWENDVLLSHTPVIAVSLTRNAEELHLLEANGIAGFLYLPTLEQAPALRILQAAAARSRYTLGSRAGAPRRVERS